MNDSIQPVGTERATTETQSTALSPQFFRLSRFDRIVIGVIAALVLALALTLVLGDRVGVQLVKVSPLGTARSTSPIVIQFSETMNRESVEQNLRLEPEVAGEFRWSGQSVLFQPDAPLEPGREYTVILERGAQSENGREVLSEYQFSFAVQPPRVAYLYPADGTPQNIWVADPNDSGSARQVTFSADGIYDFGTSPDGASIAFAERNNATQTTDIKLLDLETGGITQLTNCADSECTSPVWRPDGRMIAYNRVDFNTALGVGSSPPRVWLIDLTQTPATTRPLFSDLQISSYNPQWSADGSRISVFSRDEGLLIYDFNTNEIAAVPTRSGSPGSISPDGMQIVFPEMTFAEGQEPLSVLRLADLEAGEIHTLTEEGEPVQDERVAWSPDGETVAIARRYLDERYTRGYQIYTITLDDGTVAPLTDDPRYANAFFSWDAAGDRLVIQRFPELTEDMEPNPAGRPEIWTLDVDSGEMVLVAQNAFHPRWLP